MDTGYLLNLRTLSARSILFYPQAIHIPLEREILLAVPNTRNGIGVQITEKNLPVLSDFRNNTAGNNLSGM